MKYLISFVLLLPLALFSQSENQPKQGKFSVGLTYSPDYAYRVLKPDASALFVVKMRDSLESPKYGFTTGLNLAFRLSNMLNFETGLLFSNKGERMREVVFEHPPGQTGTQLPEKGSFIRHYFYLDIPLKAKYHFTDGRTKIFVAAGLSTNIFLTSRETEVLTYPDGSIENKTVQNDLPFNKVNLALIAGFGLSYDISQQLYFKIEPTYRRSLMPIANTPIKPYLYSAGMDVGIFYAF